MQYHVDVEIAYIPENPASYSSREVIAIRVQRDAVEVGAATGCPQVVDDNDLAVHEHLIQHCGSGTPVVERDAPQREYSGARVLQQSGVGEPRVLPPLIRGYVRILVQYRR